MVPRQPPDRDGAPLTSSAALPRVTIVTPSYNQAAYLEQTIRSVLDQRYPDLEYIVVDGGSTDGSVDIIRGYADRLAWWVSEKDHGQSHALEKGFSRATGAVLAWLNSDDLYVGDSIWQAVAALRAHPRAALVYGHCLNVDSAGRVLGPFPSKPFRRASVLRGDAGIAQPAAFWRAGALRAAGPIRRDLHYCMDLALWMAIAERYDLVYVPRVWAHFRVHATSKTTASREPFEREEAQLRREHHDRLRLLRLALARPDLYLEPSMVAFLIGRMLPRPLMRRVNRARGLPAVAD